MTDLTRFVIVSGMTLGVEVLTHLVTKGRNVAGYISYDKSLANRSNYIDPVSYCKFFGVPHLETSTLKGFEFLEILQSLQFDYCLVCGWSELVPGETLSLFPGQFLGFHMSKLPRGRGRAPIPWTIVKAEIEFGVTLQWLVKGADKGPICSQNTRRVDGIPYASDLVQQSFSLARVCLDDFLSMLDSGDLVSIPQDEKKSTYWERRRPNDGILNFDAMDSEEVVRLVRALAPPFPMAFIETVHGIVFFQEADFLNTQISKKRILQQPFFKHRNCLGFYSNCGVDQYVFKTKNGLVILGSPVLDRDNRHVLKIS